MLFRSPEPVVEVAEPVAAAPASRAEAPAREAATGSSAPGVRKRAAATEEAPDRKGKQRKRVREVVNLREQEQVKLQFTGRGGARRRAPVVSPRSVVNPRTKRRDKLNRPAAPKPAAEQPRVIRVAGEISVGELAKLLGAKAPAIQGKLMALGIMVSVNQTVDIETSRKIAGEQIGRAHV